MSKPRAPTPVHLPDPEEPPATAKIYYLSNGREAFVRVAQPAVAQGYDEAELLGSPGYLVSIKRSSQPRGQTGGIVTLRTSGTTVADGERAVEIVLELYKQLEAGIDKITERIGRS